VFVLSSASNLYLTGHLDAKLESLTGMASVVGNKAGNVVSAKVEASGASNIVQIVAPTTGKQQFMLGGYEVISLYKSEYYDPADNNIQTGYKVKVNADFDIMGTVNNIGLTQTELEVQDKKIWLAYNTDPQTPDGIANDGAGISVVGMPLAGAKKDTNPERYQKSILWNNGTGAGILGLRGASAQNESYWDVKGDAMRWTHTDEAPGNETSFIPRINNLGEFEMVKRMCPFGGGETFNKCAKFGRFV
jgi:hypothetical protein